MKRSIPVLIPAVALGMVVAGSARSEAISLGDAVNEALTSNLDLAAEKWNISVSEARRITAGLRPNPVLTVSGQTLNVFGAPYNSNSPLGPNAVVIHTDVPIERGGKRQDRVAVATEDQKLAELGVRETMRQVIFGVQSAFVDVQQNEQNLALALDNLNRLNELVQINANRQKSGDLAEVELNRTRVAATQAQATVQQARLQVAQAKARLQLLLGRKAPSDAFDVAGNLRRDSVMETEPELRDLALTRRPDVQFAAGQQARTTADVRLQLANGKFDYTIGTDYVRQSAYGISGSSMGFYFSMPLQIFNRNQGEIARAQRERSQADAKVAALQASVSAEIAQAYRQYTTAQNLLESMEGEMLQRAKSVRDTTEYAYQRGEASLIEFLDAQRAFNDATQTYNDARANYARSLYQLDAASGAAVSAI